jgi:putative ABC transport system permease protein
MFDGFINGVLTDLRHSTVHSNYGFGQINTKGYRDAVFEEPTRHWIANAGEVHTAVSQIEGVEHVFPRVSFSALLKSGKKTVSGFGQGIQAEREADFFHGLAVEEGEPLTSQPNGILLGRGLARALDVHPGDRITVMATSTKSVISKKQFTVTGIFHTGSLEFDARSFRVQLPAAQKVLKTAKIESMALGLRSFDDWNGVAREVEAAFPDLEATPFDVLDTIYYTHTVNWLNAQFDIVQIIILSMLLLGIFNSISSAILERKQEIGNLRANGESVFQVLRLIIAEGGLLAMMGSLLGTAGAYLLYIGWIKHAGILMPAGPGQTKQFPIVFSFEWSMVLFSLVLSTVTALIASLVAGLKVARMSIAASLRSL